MTDDIILEMMLNPDNVQKQLVNISTDGNVITKILDEYVNVVKWLLFRPTPITC